MPTDSHLIANGRQAMAMVALWEKEGLNDDSRAICVAMTHGKIVSPHFANLACRIDNTGFMFGGFYNPSPSDWVNRTSVDDAKPRYVPAGSTYTSQDNMVSLVSNQSGASFAPLPGMSGLVTATLNQYPVTYVKEWKGADQSKKVVMYEDHLPRYVIRITPSAVQTALGEPEDNYLLVTTTAFFAIPKDVDTKAWDWTFRNDVDSGGVDYQATDLRAANICTPFGDIEPGILFGRQCGLYALTLYSGKAFTPMDTTPVQVTHMPYAVAHTPDANYPYVLLSSITTVGVEKRQLPTT